MTSESFRVRIADQATDMLRQIGKKYGAKTYGILRDLIRELEISPEQRGEPLRGQLKGLWSLHHSRFRVIYYIDHGECVVVVVAAGYHESGSRRDIYKVIKRLVQSGQIDIKDRQE